MVVAYWARGQANCLRDNQFLLGSEMVYWLKLPMSRRLACLYLSNASANTASCARCSVRPLCVDEGVYFRDVVPEGSLLLYYPYVKCNLLQIERMQCRDRTLWRS
jgi:hypothetical protein